MATTKKPVEAAAEEQVLDPWEKINLFIPRDSEDDTNVYIGFNDCDYIAVKGKNNLLPRCVVEEYERCRAAEERLWAHQDAMLEASKVI